MTLLEKTLAAINGADQEAAAEAKKRLDCLTKPLGSLGMLEEMAMRLAAVQQTVFPQIKGKVVMIMAGDHGVVNEGVSAYPQEVTPQMVINMLKQGAAINVLARQNNAKVVLADVGVMGAPIEHPEIKQCKVRAGTGNIVREAAMTEEEAITAIEHGIRLVNEEIDNGANLIATGEMGIGNTTPSSAILAVYSAAPIAEITGLGTGIDDSGFREKVSVIKKAIENNKPDPQAPLDVLKKVGGLEIAALTGVILGAAARKVAVVVDGFISGAAALLAYKMKPECRDYMFGSHLSQEPGHRLMMELIGLKPMLHLDMRLGEGTGAVLTFNLLEAATKIISEMATFEQAGVSTQS